jgi:Protein of unknown function (DUF3866)
MPLSLRRGRVTAVTERLGDLLRLEVDGAPCVAYPRTTGGAEVGDDVVVNVQARALALGSGGFDVLYANLTRGLDLAADDGAHVMSLPYAPGQRAIRHVEESVGATDDLRALPVVCCTVHSQVVPACAALRGLRVAYVQVGGGALPVSLSDTLRALRERGLVAVTVAVAPCFDGDVQSVTVASALAWAAGAGFDVAVCSVGPGIVGTGSRLGHGALALADAANVATALGGFPILAMRVSERDERDRHRGVSHHSRTILELCLVPPTVAWPAGLDPPLWLAAREEVDASGWRDACRGLPLSFMGRGLDDEPSFFAAAHAAGTVAARRAAGRTA